MAEKSKIVGKDLDPDYLQYLEVVAADLDLVTMVLRSHLLAEYHIDQLIICHFKRGDLIVDKNFSFSQKLLIVRAMSVIRQDSLDSLAALNSLRNRCSHEMNYAVTELDIDRVGRPFGAEYAAEKKEYRGASKPLLHSTLIAAIAPLSGAVQAAIKKNGPKEDV